MSGSPPRRVAIIAGVRTPFARSGTVLKDVSAIDLGKIAVRELIHRSGIDPATVDLLAFGTVFGFFGVLLALPASAALLVGLRHLSSAYVAGPLYGGPK